MNLETSLSRLLPGLEELWAESQGDPEIVVAIIDGPVDRGHPALRDARLEVVDTLVSPEAGSGMATDHGTHVTSLIFGGPEGPVRGLAPGASGLVLPVFSEREDGTVRLCSQLDLARAITLAVAEGAHVVVVSAGQLAAGGEAGQHLAQAAALCAASNVLLVAAVGNDGCECLHVPAALPGVLAVGAVDAAGFPLESNNHGGVYALQGIVAPGEEIVGAVSGGGTAPKSGASMATAVVAGVAALLLSIERGRGGEPDPRNVRRALLASALPCSLGDPAVCSPFLRGRLNIHGALAELALRSEPAGRPPDDRSPSGSGAVAPASHPVGKTLQGGKSMETEPEVEEMEALELSPDALEVSAGGAVAPSDCHCGKGGTAAPCGCKKGSASSPVPGSRTLVYALGVIGYDFGSEARRDSFIQEGLAHPGSPEELLAHLDANPASAAAIKWTLAQDSTVLYAIAPAGPFAALAYERLREFLAEQLKSGVEQVSIPGRLAGKSILQNGQAVPTILPELRGMYSWTTGKLVEAVSGTETGATADDVRNFLQRVYYETRNLGLAPQERALNFAATNAFQVERVFTTTLGSGLKLDTISVERSPVCRPSSDCWDVKLSFFNPLRRLEQARQVHRFTIDVSDVIPVTVGAIRSWDVY